MRYDDDFTAIWRGLSIGRIMQASGVPDSPINGLPQE
jgi:hypothetical protein